jgi:hypothetical protein
MGMLSAKRLRVVVFSFGVCAAVLACVSMLVVIPVFGQKALSAVPPREFTQLADKLAADRNAEAEESEAPEEQALEMLDRVALASLDAAPDPAALNQLLAKFVTRVPPLGESFRVFPLGGNPSSFALLADFGDSGPSAVRIYSGAPGKLSLAARVDRYAQKDFLDDYIEMAPIPGPAAVFVTIAGRTDDFKTGVFTAWHFDGHTVSAVWTSDIVEQSNYQVGANGFQLDYCSDPNPDDPRVCHQMQRERFVWQDGAWRQAETATPAPSTEER